MTTKINGCKHGWKSALSALNSLRPESKTRSIQRRLSIVDFKTELFIKSLIRVKSLCLSDSKITENLSPEPECLLRKG